MTESPTKPEIGDKLADGTIYAAISPDRSDRPGAKETEGVAEAA